MAKKKKKKRSKRIHDNTPATPETAQQSTRRQAPASAPATYHPHSSFGVARAGTPSSGGLPATPQRTPAADDIASEAVGKRAGSATSRPSSKPSFGVSGGGHTRSRSTSSKPQKRRALWREVLVSTSVSSTERVLLERVVELPAEAARRRRRSTRWDEPVLLVSLSTMMELRAVSGDLVVLFFSPVDAVSPLEASLVARLWPLTKVKAGQAKLCLPTTPPALAEGTHTVRIRRCAQPVREARKVRLVPSDGDVSPLPGHWVPRLHVVVGGDCFVESRHFVVEAVDGVADNVPVVSAEESLQEEDVDPTVFRMAESCQVIVAAGDAAASAAPVVESVEEVSPPVIIGGLDKQLATLQELFELPPRFRPRGVLLHGPPGTGKTLLVRALCASLRPARTLFSIDGPSVISKYEGESERELRRIFEAAQSCANGALIFVDEIDALCGSRWAAAAGQLQRRLVTTLLLLLDGLGSGDDAETGVVVVAATNRPDALDPALRRPGRFDREMEIGIPTRAARLDILRKMLAAVSAQGTLSGEFVEHLSSVTHGYVGADLRALCSEAAMLALLESDDPSAVRLNEAHFKAALTKVRPSAMREVMVDVPQVKWSDIGGHADIKARLQEAVEWPLRSPEAFARMGISPPKGILLYGPPGCSKTLMAKALANESSRNFIAVKGPELFSKWVGDSEKAVQRVFRKARAAAPSIVFFDEIDSIAMRRSASGSGNRVADRVLSQLLVEMDGVEPLSQVTIVAATNRPDILDPALLRPGRIDSLLYVSPPDQESAAAIFALQLAKMAHDAEDVDVARLAELAVGLSGAEIVAVCRDAATRAMEEDHNAELVRQRHLEDALSAFEPRISKEMLAFYEQFRAAHGGSG